MKSRVINIVILVITILTTIAVVSVMPDIVPVHFDINGEPDRFGSKYEMFMLPAVLLLMQVISEFSVHKFKKIAETSDDGKVKSDAESNIKVFEVVYPVIGVFVYIIHCFAMYQSYSQLENVTLPQIAFEKIIAVLFGILLIMMGNYMTKTRRNSVLGFRHVWTVYNDVTWSKSNRFAGFTSVVAGFINVILGIILPGMLPVIILLASLILSVVIMMIYAYKVYMEERMKND